MQNSQEQLQGLRSDMLAGFAKVDERFAKVDERFAKVDERLAKVDERFAKVDDRFALVDIQFEETRRHFDVVAESIYAKLDLVLEILRSERSERHSLTDRVERLEDGEITIRNRLALLERKNR